MIPVASSVAGPLALVVAGFLLVLGLLFLFAPSKGLLATKHHAEDLPIIMAGRYFFLAFIVFMIARQGSPFLLANAFFGLAGLAFFDAITYGMRNKPVMPHLLAGIGALTIPAIALWGQN